MIVPGSVNPLLMAAGGDPLDEYFKIVRGVRYRAPASPSFHRVMAAGANRKKGAISLWLKPTKITSASVSNNGNLHLFMGDNSTNLAGSGLSAYSRAVLVGDDSTGLNRLQWHSSGSAGEAFLSNPFYRDPLAHAHLYVRWDSTVPMLEAYWNGVEISYSSRTLPTLNADTIIGVAAGLLKLGMFTSGDPRYFDGVFSDFRVFLGQAPAVTTLGIAHPITGQWRPTGFAGTYGAYDSYLDFSDNSAATAAAIGADRSGNGNNWTPTNISLTVGATYDSVTDTPTKNFATLNPLAANGGTVTDGGLSFTGAASTHNVYATQPFPATGKYCFECYPSATTDSLHGLAFGVCAPSRPINSGLGVAGTYMYYSSNGGYLYTNGSLTSSGFPYITGGYSYQCAVDLDAGKVWLGYHNGTTQFWHDSTGGTTGNPATGANPTFTVAAGGFFPCIQSDSGNATYFYLNFGQKAFKGTMPTGYGTLNTKDLKLPAVPKGTSAFVAVTDSGANVQTTLATARAGWPDYIEIFKSWNSVEGWRWRFSDDLANYLDSSSTAGKAAFPALGGTSYDAFALKVSALNGVATGRLTHTNGAADVVADNLGTSRKAIILKNEATGTWYFYHPELTAGKLLYLETTGGETTDATIGTVITNSFTVAAALASGTYRWVALADLQGFLSLSAYIANSSAEGPFVNGGLSPALSLQKSTSGSAGRVKNYARSPYNVSKNSLDINATGAGDPNSNSVDYVSGGLKERANDAMNVASQKYITILIALFPFRYANSR